MGYLLAEPHVIASLPDNFEMIILPSDDPELRLYNLELLDRYERENRPVVLVRLKSGTVLEVGPVRPDLYIPVVA
ncbi:MAG: hypothetical protein EXR62_07990 [Chloroflexi bacterium]|nr:hypothetical protein [Chloroflexota bacterium]